MRKLEASPRPKELRNPRDSRNAGFPCKKSFLPRVGGHADLSRGPQIRSATFTWPGAMSAKKIFSIRTKRTVEILRHHRTEKHIRRDQRWRYEHEQVKSVTPITLTTQHRVVLSKIKLAKELSKIIHGKLVDIGEQFSSYEHFIRGRTTPLITPESRARTQLCIIGDFIQS